MTKTAFITGITGQDGSYLSELLLGKNYKVIGLISSKHNIGFHNIKNIQDKLILETGDLLDETSLERIILKYKPDEIYNLGGVTFIPLSWEKPILTFKVNTLAVLSMLNIINKNLKKTRFFQATSAKIFGDPLTAPQTEETEIRPFGPYGVSKASSHFLVQNYRNHFNLFAVSGIMYNHESERRGIEFVTRKITYNAAQIKLGRIKSLTLGDIDARQDWGYAPDYVEAIWLMLQQEKASDYIIASGELHSVKEVCEIAFNYLGLNWKKYVKYDQSLVRKEVAKKFYGDSSRAKKILGWKPKTSFVDMIKKMVDNDLKLSKGVKQ